MSCPQGSARGGFRLARKINDFSPLEVLPARVYQSSHLSLISHPWLLDPHGSTLGDLFNYEDGSHVIIVTILKENAYDLNMNVADFKRTNMLPLPPNLKKMLPT